MKPLTYTRLAIVFSLLFITGTSQAQEDTHKWEVTALGGYNLVDLRRHLEDGYSGSLGIGYVIQKDWSLELMYEKFDSAKKSNNMNIDGQQIRLDALYKVANMNGWKPFFLMGLGNQRFSPRSIDAGNETIANVGLGIKKKLSRHWLFRADTRALYGFDDDKFDNSFNVGVSYLFGYAAHKTPPRPVEQPSRDSDNDGVLDGSDQCPGTPANVVVNRQGCPLDDDEDGVANYKDRCPNTPHNYEVDKFGCQLTRTKAISFNLSLHFAVDSAKIESYDLADIDKIANYMRKHKSAKVTIEGYTDNTGTAAYNKNLSKRRATAVRSLLVNDFNLDAEHLSAVGYGEENPVADNSTAQGRASNRRVVATVYNKIKKPVMK